MTQHTDTDNPIDLEIRAANRRLDAIAMELIFLSRPDGKDHLRGLWAKRGDLDLPPGMDEEDAHTESLFLQRVTWDESRFERAGVKA